jgi:hypothetical protein
MLTLLGTLGGNYLVPAVIAWLLLVVSELSSDTARATPGG